ncbi:TPA: tail fiber assembly protein [Vibrio vulnificus]|nr:tail fiber assembly protein [Vibrio vulnificus]
MGETNYIFSAVQNGFLPLVWKKEKEAAGTWPDDAVEISYEDYLKFTTDAPEGKMLGSDKKGNPAWVDIPPLTAEELIQQAEETKQRLITEASQKTQLWQTQLMLDIITEEDKASLTEWMLYVQKVQAVDTSAAPDIDWPVKPE